LIAEVQGSVSEGSAYRSALELLDSDKPPDGIYATLDRLALGALLAANARAVSVPDALRIAGCTDSDASRSAQPPLTALSLDPDRLGREAVDLLLALVEDDDPTERKRIVPTTVIPRASTGR
jgi:DNA-binding LacI/PurR family transcriptional regulator